MPTIQDLGQMVKQKYPGAYDDMQDIDVGKAVQQKYPGSYDDFTDVQPVNQDIGGNTGNILGNLLGGNKIGEFIGAKAGQYLPESLGGPRPQDRPFYSTQGPTAGQLAGDIGQVGLTLGTLGGAGATGGLIAQTGKSALLGGGFGLAGSLKNQQGLSDTATNVGEGALIGGAIPLVAHGLGYLGSKISQGLRGGAEGLVQSEIPATGNALGKQIKLADIGNPENPNFPQKFLDYQTDNPKMFLTQNSARKTIQREILPDIYKQWDEISDSNVGLRKIDVSDLLPKLNDVSNKLGTILGDDHPIVKSIQDAAEAGMNNAKMQWKNALILRRGIDSGIPNGLWNNPDPTIQGAVRTLLDTRSTLADRLLAKAQDTNFGELNETYGLYKGMYDRLLAVAKKPALNLIERLALGGSAIAAPFTGGGSALATGAGIAAEQALRSYPAKIGGALAMNKLSQIIPQTVNPALQGVGQIGAQSLLRFLNGQ